MLYLRTLVGSFLLVILCAGALPNPVHAQSPDAELRRPFTETELEKFIRDARGIMRWMAKNMPPVDVPPEEQKMRAISQTGQEKLPAITDPEVIAFFERQGWDAERFMILMNRLSSGVIRDQLRNARQELRQRQESFRDIESLTEEQKKEGAARYEEALNALSTPAGLAPISEPELGLVGEYRKALQDLMRDLRKPEYQPMGAVSYDELMEEQAESLPGQDVWEREQEKAQEMMDPENVEVVPDQGRPGGPPTTPDGKIIRRDAEGNIIFE